MAPFFVVYKGFRTFKINLGSNLGSILMTN